jgi:hypothetical protein
VDVSKWLMVQIELGLGFGRVTDAMEIPSVTTSFVFCLIPVSKTTHKADSSGFVWHTQRERLCGKEHLDVPIRLHHKASNPLPHDQRPLKA